MTTVIVRNGFNLCAGCRAKGCMLSVRPDQNDECENASDAPCDCCELDPVEINDGFGA